MRFTPLINLSGTGGAVDLSAHIAADDHTRYLSLITRGAEQVINDDIKFLGRIKLEDAVIEHNNITHDPVYLSGQSGLNDLSSSGTYALTDNAVFQIKIDSTGTPDNFVWRKGSSGAWSGSVAMTGSAQLLQDGISITWAATTGHTLNDEWEMAVGHMIHFEEAVHLLDDLIVNGDAVIAGVMRSLSPLKIAGGIDLLIEAKVSTNLTKMDFMVGSSTPFTLNDDGTVKVNGNSLSVSRSIIPITGSDRVAINFGGGGSLIGATAATDALFLSNAYYNSGYKYLTTDFASAIKLGDGKITLQTAPSGIINNSISWSSRFTVLNNGNVGIGTDAPNGLLDLRGGNFVLSNSGITHPMTDLFPTNVYGGFFPNSASTGGLVIDGLSDHLGASGMMIRGFIGSTNPTDTVAAVGFRAGKSDGSTGKTDLGALETAYQFSNNDNSIKYLTIGGGGNVFIGDTANTKTTKGLTINQGANDDEIFALKSSDVNHSVTWTESDTYFCLKKLNADGGGILIRGVSDGDYTGLRINGIIGANNPADTTPAIVFQSHKYNGATAAEAIGDAETILAIQNGPTQRVVVLGNGNVGMGTDSPTSTLQVVGLVEYANNAAAISGGLTIGAFYRTGGDPDQVCAVY